MPLFDPRTPVELNAAKKLLEGAGTLSDIVGNLYNKYAPAPVKDVVDYWNNTPDPIPGPSPDDPLKMASIVVPWLLMRGGKAAAKAKKIVEKKFGVRDVEELMNIPFTRYQQEAVDIPVSQGGRGGIFTTPSIGHTKVDPDMYNNSWSGVEGGAHKVQGVATTKNPLFIDRDIRKYPDESHEYLGARVMKDLLGAREAENVQLAITHKTSTTPPKYGGWYLQEYNEKLRRGEKVINSLFTPKERKILYSAKAGNIAMEEAVANKLANRAGYDSIINLRQFTKGWEPSDTFATYINKAHDRDKLRSPYFGGSKAYQGFASAGNKHDLALAQNRKDLESLMEWLGPDKDMHMLRPFRRLLTKAYKSKASPQLTRADLENLQEFAYNSSGSMGDLSENFQKVYNKFRLPKDSRGYNATQMVLLDPTLQKQGAKAVNKLQIDELMNTPPEVLKASQEYPNATQYFVQKEKTPHTNYSSYGMQTFLGLNPKVKTEVEKYITQFGYAPPQELINKWK